MSSKFERAFAILLRLEGGDSAHPADKGGRTRYGISQAAYPDVRIDRLTLDDAKAIYLTDYWRPLACELFPGSIAVALFDGGVNHGRKLGLSLMQEIVGVARDGLNGPKTQTAIQSRCTSPEAVEDLLTQYLTRRARLYHDIANSHPDQAVFLNGWVRRLFLLTKLIHSEI